MKSLFIRHSIFAVVIIAVILLLLEGGARLLESLILSPPSPNSELSGWQNEFFGSLFEWHEADPDLLWRFRSGLDNPLITTNSEHLLGPELSRKKPSNTYRVLIAGDSSPVGLGLASRQQTFAEILRRLLDHQFASRKQVEVINGAVSGYSSEQVRRFLDIKGWAYDPDLVIVYCGNNDASLSGPLTDSELLAGQRFKSLRKFFSHLALYRMMRSLILSGNRMPNGTDGNLKIRVSPEDYGTNMEAVAEQGRQHHCPVIFLIPPVPHLWPAGLQFKPFLHYKRTDGRILLPAVMADYLGREIAYCIDESRFHELYGQGDIFTREVYRSAHFDTLNPAEAISHYTARIELEPENPVPYNDLGVAYWRNGDFPEADSAFKKALYLFRQQHPGTEPTLAGAASPFFYNLGINSLSRDSIKDFSQHDSASDAIAYLDSALQADYYSLRIKRPYVLELERLRGKPEVAVIDLPRIFRENGGERLFIDHCHPTAEGHFLIARAIYDTIRGRRW